jgi:hypothetical protein
MVSARIEALSRPPVASSPRPSHLGECAHVDDGGPQLGQLALGQVGVGPVERVGDDQAEHRVAEELQALVVGQAAVLVRERAVGEGTHEQRLVDPLPDHLDEVVEKRADGSREFVAVRGRRRHEVTRSGPAQPWCSERSAVA